VHLDGDRIVGIEGDHEHPLSRGYLCPKGEAVIELVYAPDRLRYPMRREGDGWEKISWDEALATIVKRLKEIKERHGAQAVVIYNGHPGVIQGIRPYILRFCHLYSTPNFSSSGSQCYVARVIGNALTYGCLPIPDYENARCIVVWGSNPAASSPLSARAIFESQGRGAKLIVIDPATTPMAERADIHLRIKPGTDGALALGMLNVIISEGLYDKEFVDKWTVGFDKLVELVKGYPRRGSRR
jgi:anaerobic selenocysteine-containing dehydrogenase